MRFLPTTRGGTSRSGGWFTSAAQRRRTLLLVIMSACTSVLIRVPLWSSSRRWQHAVTDSTQTAALGDTSTSHGHHASRSNESVRLGLDERVRLAEPASTTAKPASTLSGPTSSASSRVPPPPPAVQPQAILPPVRPSVPPNSAPPQIELRYAWMRLPRGAARDVTRSGLLDLTRSSEFIGPTRRVSAAQASLVNGSASEASCASFCRSERRACAGYAWRSTAEATVAECYLIARSESRGDVCAPPRLRGSAGLRGICGGGIVSADESACCDVTCGRCGGSGCGTLPGGPRNCCTQRILATASCCSRGGGPPCVVRSQGPGSGAHAADASGTGATSDALRSTPPPPLLPPTPLPPLPPLLPCEALNIERSPHIASAAAPARSTANAVVIPPPAVRGVWRVRSAAQRAADLAAALAADDDVSPGVEAPTSSSVPGRMLSSASTGGAEDDTSDAIRQTARFVLVTVRQNGNRAH